MPYEKCIVSLFGQCEVYVDGIMFREAMEALKREEVKLEDLELQLQTKSENVSFRFKHNFKFSSIMWRLANEMPSSV
jgi:hypothetical protein